MKEVIFVILVGAVASIIISVSWLFISLIVGFIIAVLTSKVGKIILIILVSLFFLTVIIQLMINNQEKTTVNQPINQTVNLQESERQRYLTNCNQDSEPSVCKCFYNQMFDTYDFNTVQQIEEAIDQDKLAEQYATKLVSMYSICKQNKIQSN